MFSCYMWVWIHCTSPALCWCQYFAHWHWWQHSIFSYYTSTAGRPVFCSKVAQLWLVIFTSALLLTGIFELYYSILFLFPRNVITYTRTNLILQYVFNTDNEFNKIQLFAQAVFSVNQSRSCGTKYVIIRSAPKNN